MTLKTAKISAALLRKGFCEEASKHKMFFLYANGKKTSVKTFISHGENEIGDWLIKQMSKQMELSKDDFIKFVDCELKKEDYLKKMVADGKVILD